MTEREVSLKLEIEELKKTLVRAGYCKGCYRHPVTQDTAAYPGYCPWCNKKIYDGMEG